MRKRKLVLGLCMAAMMAGMVTGCGKEAVKEPAATGNAEQITTEAPTTEEVTTETPVEASIQAPEGSENWVNMETRCFTVNGKTYQLGVNILQDLIDDGVPFKEDDLANAGNNLNPDTESDSFAIVLGEYWNALVCTTNTSDENKTIAECVLSQIYMPIHEGEEQQVLSFAFPFTVTEEQLVAAAGQPTNRDEFEDGDYINHELEYKTESEKYYHDSGYDFEFTNGMLSYITIDWIE